MEMTIVDEDRLNRLEKQVQELAKITSDIEKKVSTISEAVSSRRFRDTESKRFMSEIPEERINPWASQAASGLQYALANEVARLQNVSYDHNAKRYDPYRVTLTALNGAKEGYTAEEVSKITNRRRNTESGYLYRLHLAGLVNRKTRGKKVLYELNRELVNSAFGKL
jgi:hypothetical protein